MGGNTWSNNEFFLTLDEARAMFVEGMWTAFNETSDQLSSVISRYPHRPSPDDIASMATEHLDQFKEKCLKTVSKAYQRHLRFASPEKAKKRTLQGVYRWFEWPGDVLESWEQELLRGRLTGPLPDRFTQWFRRARLSDAAIRQFDPPSIGKQFESALRQGLDEVERAVVQEEFRLEVRTKKAAAEARTSGQKKRGPAVEKGEKVPRKLMPSLRRKTEIAKKVKTLMKVIKAIRGDGGLTSFTEKDLQW